MLRSLISYTAARGGRQHARAVVASSLLPLAERRRQPRPRHAGPGYARRGLHGCMAFSSTSTLPSDLSGELNGSLADTAAAAASAATATGTGTGAIPPPPLSPGRRHRRTSQQVQSSLLAVQSELSRAQAPAMPIEELFLSPNATVTLSPIVEQIAVLEICLATGNIARAKRIFAQIRSEYNKDKAQSYIESGGASTSASSAARRTKFSELVPVGIHTTFLRAFFRQALVHGSANSKGGVARKRMYVSEAWEWLDMLLKNERLYGRVEDAAWAVMFKGSVATQLTHPNPRLQDPSAPHLRSLAHLYNELRTHRRSLEAILQDPIFSHAGLAGLNDHGALEVLEELAAVLAESGESEAVIELDDLRTRMVDKMRYQEEGKGEDKTLGSGKDMPLQQAQRLSPWQADEPAVHIQPASRTEKESIPFRLDSLLGNLTTIKGQRLQTTDPYVRQDLLEESAYDAARWQSMHDRDQLDKVGLGTETRLKGNQLQAHMKTWLDALTAELKLALCDDPSPRTAKSTALDSDVQALLGLLDVEKLAYITIVETLRNAGGSSMTDGIKAVRAIIFLGRAIEDEFGAEAWKVLYPDLYDKAMASAAGPAAESRTGGRDSRSSIRKFMMEQGIAAGAANAAHREGYGDEADELRNISDEAERAAKQQARDRAMPWTQKMRAKVGGFLLKALLDVATVLRREKIPSTGEWVEQTQPAFYQSYQFFRGNKVGVIKLNEAISSRLDKDSMDLSAFPRFLPMLVPPKPWTRWNLGGYRIHSTDIMRIRESPEQVQFMKMASEQGQLDQVFAALDVLGRTPWKINKPVFDIVMQVWNSGEAFADIPINNAETKIPDPKPPSAEQLRDPRDREAYRVQLKQVRNARSTAHSQRCDLNYKLEIAKAYLNETFYFPHNVDFRGRAYPIPPNLSHIGDDMSRGLLIFAEGKPLGARGLMWLHVQVANSYGFDKASFADREAWTKERLLDVYDSADRPLEGGRWWLKADDPWQCLSACKELTNALRSPVPEEYTSHLPVQQDGTCNGLQHYAALGGDETGAAQVNLAEGAKPADVYTAVAKIVNANLERDLTGADSVKARVASELQGKVTRKVVKQTVMTTVYGVTFVGAKRQIQRQLKDRGDIALDVQFHAASYLAEKVLSSIGDLFKGASAIQIWLSVCARLIGRAVRVNEDGSVVGSKDPMASVIWTTPLGLPVAQPYRKQKKSQIMTALQTVFITDPNAPSAIDARAQATAFPPNFIHSLDATHMMMTATECGRRGLAFASVHDSYWTHACDVDTMSVALRDCFIRLHSQDLLGQLKAGFQARYADFAVRQSSTTAFAQSLTARRRASESKGTVTVEEEDAQRRRDLGELAKDLGASALPPLAIAAEKQLMQDAMVETRDMGESESEDDDLEESSFSEDADSDVSPVAAGGKVKKGKKANPTTSTRKKRTTKPAHTGGSEYLMLSDLLPDVPERGTFDLARIRDSPYFFS